jgi:hypothetical protein
MMLTTTTLGLMMAYSLPSRMLVYGCPSPQFPPCIWTDKRSLATLRRLSAPFERHAHRAKVYFSAEPSSLRFRKKRRLALSPALPGIFLPFIKVQMMLEPHTRSIRSVMISRDIT